MLNVNEIKLRIKSSHFRTYNNFAKAMEMTSAGLKKIFKNGRTKPETILRMCDLLEMQPHQVMTEDAIENIMNQEQKTGVSQRLSMFMREKNITPSDFAATLCISKSTLATILSRDSCNLLTLQRICKKYPELSCRWIILGLGQMTNDFEHLDNFSDMKASEPESTYSTDVKTLRDELKIARDEIKFLTKMLNSRK